MKIFTPIPLAFIFLTACQQNIDSPRQVAEQYWQAVNTGNTEAAYQLVATGTEKSLDDFLALPDAERARLQALSFGEQQATVITIISTADSNATNRHHTFATTLVFEDDQWKVDASRTLEAITPELTDKRRQPSDSFDEALKNMDETLKESADMLNEFLHEGSQEMGESLRKGVDEMNEALREALEKMKKRREQQESEPAPSDDGEGLI